MVVTTPGARSHYMRSGIAKVEQKFELVMVRFRIQSGSLILQKSTSLEQKTLIDITENAEVLYFEKMPTW